MNQKATEAAATQDGSQILEQQTGETETAKVHQINQPWNDEKLVWNDAYIHGDPCEAFDRLMIQQAQITLGVQFDGDRPKGKHDTPKGEWKSTASTWAVIIAGHPGSFTKSEPTAGFSRHGVASRKDGPGYVLGVCDGGQRGKLTMSTMYAIGLDYDLNVDLDDLIFRLEDLNIAACLYTTFNNGTTEVTVDKTKAAELSGGDVITIDGVRAILREKGFDENFLARVEILEGDVIKNNKRFVRCSCPPITKARVIVPLQEPIDLTKLTANPTRAAEMYSARVRGLSQIIGFQHDGACEDPSRIFFVGAHPKTATEDDYYTAIFRAPPIRWEDIPEVEKPGKIGAKSGSTIPQGVTVEVDGETINVTDLYYRYGKRWNLTDIIPVDKFHGPSSDGVGEVIECPFQHKHTDTEKIGGTVAYDPDPDADESWKHYANIHCSHTCGAQFHLVTYLAEWLEQRLIAPADLEDAAYMVPLVDGQDETFCRPTPEEMMAKASASAESYVDNDDLETRCGAFTKQSKAAEIEAFLKDLFNEGIDATDRERVNAWLVENTVLKLRGLNKMWQALDRVKAKIDKDKAKVAADDSGYVMKSVGEPQQCAKAQMVLLDKNKADPFLFVRNGVLCTVEPEDDVAAVKLLKNQSAFAYYLNTAVRFGEQKGENGIREIVAPVYVERHLFNAPRHVYPTLDKVTTTPFFSATGELVTEEGYHAATKTYFDPGDFVVPGVSRKPTKQEMEDALNRLVGLVADFPFGGITDRATIEKQFWDTEKGGVPSLVHFLSALLTMFARDLFGRIAPGLLINKPSPGTGASLLVDLFAIIATGRTVGGHKPSPNELEWAKSLAGFILDGRPITYLDNIDFLFDSADLAAAMTAERYSPRILGASDVSELDVNTTFIFTANGLIMTWELLRRNLLCDLDAKREDPENRGGFKLDDPKGHVTENRAEFVHACLTVIQFWVANGQKENRDDDKKLASFESWSRRMGGLWDACGVPGFMGNEDVKKADLTDDKRDDERLLIRALAEAAFKTKKQSKGYEIRVTKDGGPTFTNVMDVLHSFGDEPLDFPDWIKGPDPNLDDAVLFKPPRTVSTKFGKLVLNKTYTVKTAGQKYSVSFEVGDKTPDNSKRWWMTVTLLDGQRDAAV
ncbi:hypothetical protein K3722_12130 [Leisingera caerulea]|uniref:Uncharacterized protein n=1 Tax=Leisingera caerulea TaxID=506591 RepID=A0ABY5WSW8_LEICA|nr:hypothetical protein [Leisingera caerulea]UWQ57273.1 hypothetical protein K3722_12130 [Leisingera caerulea]